MPRFSHDPELHLVDSLDEALRMKSWLGERREHNVIGLDTETSGLNPYVPGAKLRLVQIGDERTGWAVPWETWGGAVLECLKAWEGDYVCHNVAMEYKWLKVHAGWEIPWERVHDTQIMSQILKPGAGAALKNLAVEKVDSRANAGEKLLKDAFKKNGWWWDNVPIHFEPYWFYGALDPVLTANLYSQFVDQVPWDVYDLEMGVRRICSIMEHNGMRIDTEYSKQKFDELSEYVERSEQWAKDTWGISISSNEQLVKFFSEDLGAHFTKLTPKGAKSVDKNQMALFSISEDRKVREAAQFILEVRKYDKVNNSYFKNFLDMNVDGVLHPSIRTLGARTSRMSVTEPALQTIPSGDSLVRNAFIPSNEGEQILSCDYSQIEFRLLSHFSGDADLQKAFHDADATGGDFFTNLGKRIYSDPEFSKKDSRRKLVKSTLYGLIYGAGVEKMAVTAGIPVSEMKPVADAVHESYPGIKQFMKNVEKIGSTREKNEGQAYITTAMGRKIPADEGKTYALVNYLLQGSAAELMKMSIVKLDAAGYTDALRMPIHDEMVFSMPKEDIEEASHDIEQIMSLVDGSFAVDLLAEPDPGLSRWGEKYSG